MIETEVATAGRLLAIDPSLRSAGYGIIEHQNKQLRTIEFGTILNPAAMRQSECLKRIHDRIAELIRMHKPDAIAMESIIYVQSCRTAIILGAARGAAILAAAQAAVPIYEYSPRRVKQSVVGLGGAQKRQVAFMVRAELHLAETPSPDAADALAIGITHFQIQSSPLQRTKDGLRI